MHLVDQIITLLRQGYSDSDIIAQFKDSFPPAQIEEALNQAKIKLELTETAGGIEPETPETPTAGEAAAGTAPATATAAGTIATQTAQTAQAPAPEWQWQQPSQTPQQAQTAQVEQPYYATESIEEIAEAVIAEKWEEFKSKVGDITEFKTHVETRLKELNDRLKRVEIALDRINAAILTKMEEQESSVKNLTREVEGLENTLTKIINPLVSSVKELKEITETAKKEKKKKLS